MSLSETATRAAFALQTGEVFVPYAKITHASLDSPILVINNNEPITRSDGVYQPHGFDVDWPESSDDTAPSSTLTMDNVDVGVTNAIRDLVGDPPIVETGVFLASSPDVAEFGPYEMSLQQAQYDESQLQLSLGTDEDPMNLQVPWGTYNPGNSPTLF